MPFTHKQLSVTFDIGEGKFGESGFNRVKLDAQLRASALITEIGGPNMGSMDLTISGMTLSNMNQFSTLGMKVNLLRRNFITLEAGEVGGKMSTVFQGTIIDAWSDFGAMPHNTFIVSAKAGLIEALKPIPPSSYKGLADVATVMKSLASQSTPPLAFTNDGVDVKIIDPYYPGTIREQMQRCADASGINWVIDKGTLSIWPKGGARGKLIPIVSPETGMIGYPTYAANGLMITTVYNPSISFGQRIKVESQLKPACGEWIIQTLSHSLDSETPNGQWNSRMLVVEPGFFVRAF